MSRLTHYIILLLTSLIQIASSNDTDPDTSKSLTEKDNLTFIADQVLEGLLTQIPASWAYLKENMNTARDEDGILEKRKEIWNVIFEEKLKTWHEKIRYIDTTVEENRPSKILNPKVNLESMPDFENLLERVDKKDESLEWIDYVKDGWVKITSMMAQIHFKYDFYFDPVFDKSLDTNGEEFDWISNETLQIYFAWFKIHNENSSFEEYTLNLPELSKFSKIVAEGTDGIEKNMFHGLKALLDLPSGEDTVVKEGREQGPCPENVTFAGKGGDPYKYLPVYVLLHLLNAEFKYYIIQNIGAIYSCIHGRSCDLDKQESTKEHLNLYYKFYMRGMMEAFESAELNINTPNEIPQDLWRWRCDPPPLEEPEDPKEPHLRDHKEDATFTRMYDFEMAFIQHEKNVTMTQTCRDSCEMIDGAYSTIPCPESSWDCLDQEKHFDCYERRRLGIKCPVARKMCPVGISCQTAALQTAHVCQSQKPGRHLEWIKADNGNEIMGKKTTCESEVKDISTEQIMERSAILKREPQLCEICICKCWEPLLNDTHRYISLIPQEADGANGYVMMGARFIKIENIIHLVIEEGKLVNGEIDTDTIRWKEPKAGLSKDNSAEVFRTGKDSRKIHLDDFLAPPGHIISGVRFVPRTAPIAGDYQSETKLVSHNVYLMEVSETQMWHYNLNESELAIEVQITSLSKEGILGVDNKTWLSNANMSVARNEVKMDEPDVSTFSEEASVPMSGTNEFIVIRASSIPKDAGQTPVPFFDAQNLTGDENELSPLRAFGLFHKARPGYGGFLTLRMLPTVQPEIPPQDPSFNLWKLKKLRNLDN